MYVLFVRDLENRKSKLVPYREKEYIFPELNLAEEKGQEILALKEYNSFHTMEINSFIEMVKIKITLEEVLPNGR